MIFRFACEGAWYIRDRRCVLATCTGGHPWTARRHPNHAPRQVLGTACRLVPRTPASFTTPSFRPLPLSSYPFSPRTLWAFSSSTGVLARWISCLRLPPPTFARRSPRPRPFFLHSCRDPQRALCRLDLSRFIPSVAHPTCPFARQLSACRYPLSGRIRRCATAFVHPDLIQLSRHLDAFPTGPFSCPWALLSFGTVGLSPFLTVLDRGLARATAPTWAVSCLSSWPRCQSWAPRPRIHRPSETAS